ncbi:TIGR03545 family protein [Exilibacterium tricleocarpae]|uniref:TIGR03545 family protein n=1 Tax=Exilibacterium tricleocarpae TaxID=2591008 RepID=A0A545U3J4_9GAMM|nr:TIGR03545 family protein [Exilibacterium tricleocarpae]TQV83994.1 TIGR03545 family protein [Exilibacterium tricleocarpae]
MGQVIRWPGIGAFFAVIALLIAVGLLWIDTLFENGLEATATEIVGARVELEAASVSLLEQSVELRGLAVANPDRPMTNMLEAERIRFDLAFGPLLWRRLHIDSMVVAGVQLNTPRQESGALEGGRLGERVATSLSGLLPAPTLPRFELPSPAEAVANEQLQTPAAVEALERDIEKKTEHIQESIDRLPDAEDIAAYRERLRALKAKDFDPLALLAKSDEIKSLRADFKADIARIKALRKEISATQTYLRDKLAEVKKMPQADVERIRNKYSLSGDWLEGLTGQIFGRQIAGWVDRGWRWFKTLQPYLGGSGRGGDDAAPPPPARGQGVAVRFAETEPAPEFLIKEMLLSAGDEQRQARVSGELHHLNDQPGAWPHPITFALAGEGIDAVPAFQLDGRIDRRQAVGQDRMTLALQGLKAENLVLSAAPAFPVTIDSGTAQVGAVFSARGREVDLSVDIGIEALSMPAPATGGAEGVADALLRAVAELDAVNFTIGVKGDIEQPQISIDSDLDRLLGDVLKRELARETAAFTQKIEGEVLKKTQGLFAPLNERLGGLEGMLSQVNDKGKVMDGLLDRL